MMIYLTEARVSFEEAVTPRSLLPKGLIDSYAWHQAVWQAFPTRVSSERDFLTRLDTLNDGYRLIMLSATEPSCPEWCVQWKTTIIRPEYLTRERYAFQLRANPTKKVRVGHDRDGTRVKNGLRIPLCSQDELVAWLNRKAELGGFTVEEHSLQIAQTGANSFLRKGRSGQHSVVDFSGTLKVTDVDCFKTAFQRGIGSAKAFGFGLLMIVPTS